MREASSKLQQGATARSLNLCCRAQSTFCVWQVSYLHSQALCSVKLMKTLLCCLRGFILFICEERYGDKVKGLDDGSRRAVTRCKVPQTESRHRGHIFTFTFSAGCGWFRLSLFDWKIITANSSSRRAKFPTIFHKQCGLNCAFSCIFCFSFFLIKKTLINTWNKLGKSQWKGQIPICSHKRWLKTGLRQKKKRGQKYCCYFASRTGEGYCADQKGRCGVTSEQK